MEYRIRYRAADVGDDEEFVVQANSPTEALVKFHHTHPDGEKIGRSQANVTSVSLTDPNATQG